MGGRTLPTECDDCGGIIDWGDFGSDESDGSVGATCNCPLIVLDDKPGIRPVMPEGEAP